LTTDDTDSSLMFVDIQLTLPGNEQKMARKTPMETKAIKRVLIEMEDGSELELPVDDENTTGSFYRSNQYVRNGKRVTIHEVYVAYGNS